MDYEKLRRIKKTIIAVLAVTAAGALYLVLVCVFDRGVPCVFYKLTGLRCPGCGITRFITRVIALEPYDALSANPFAPFIILFCLCAAVNTSAVYIRTGVYRLSAGSEIFEYAFLAAVIAWGAARNILGI